MPRILATQDETGGFDLLGDILGNGGKTPNGVYDYSSGDTFTDVRDIFTGSVSVDTSGVIPKAPPVTPTVGSDAPPATDDMGNEIKPGSSTGTLGQPIHPVSPISPITPITPTTPTTTSPTSTPGSPTVNITPPPDTNTNPYGSGAIPYEGFGPNPLFPRGPIIPREPKASGPGIFSGGFDPDVNPFNPTGEFGTGFTPGLPVQNDGGGGGGGGGGWPGAGGGGGTGGGGTPAEPPFNLGGPGALPNFPIFGGNEDALKRALLALAFQSGAFDLATKKELFETMFPELKGMLQSQEGFSPSALAAMRGQAITGTGRQFASTEQSLRRSLSARGLRGGNAPVSGLAGREFSELGAARAAFTSEQLQNVNIANEQQRLQNLFNAFNIASGFPSNPASSIGAGASVPGTPAGFWERLGGSLAGQAASSGLSALGQALAGIFNRGGGSIPGSTGPQFPSINFGGLFG